MSSKRHLVSETKFFLFYTLPLRAETYYLTINHKKSLFSY